MILYAEDAAARECAAIFDNQAWVICAVLRVCKIQKAFAVQRAVYNQLAVVQYAD